MISNITFENQKKMWVGNEDYYQIIAEATGHRSSLIIHNPSKEESIFVAFTQDARDNDAGIPLPPGATMSFDEVVPKNAVYIKTEKTWFEVLYMVSGD